jgi:hypothetical protein
MTAVRHARLEIQVVQDDVNTKKDRCLGHTTLSYWFGRIAHEPECILFRMPEAVTAIERLPRNFHRSFTVGLKTGLLRYLDVRPDSSDPSLQNRFINGTPSTHTRLFSDTQCHRAIAYFFSVDTGMNDRTGPFIPSTAGLAVFG